MSTNYRSRRAVPTDLTSLASRDELRSALGDDGNDQEGGRDRDTRRYEVDSNATGTNKAPSTRGSALRYTSRGGGSRRSDYRDRGDAGTDRAPTVASSPSRVAQNHHYGAATTPASNNSGAPKRKCMLFLFNTRTLMYRYPAEDIFTVAKGFELGDAGGVRNSTTMQLSNNGRSGDKDQQGTDGVEGGIFGVAQAGGNARTPMNVNSDSDALERWSSTSNSAPNSSQSSRSASSAPSDDGGRRKKAAGREVIPMSSAQSDRSRRRGSKKRGKGGRTSQAGERQRLGRRRSQATLKSQRSIRSGTNTLGGKAPSERGGDFVGSDVLDDSFSRSSSQAGDGFGSSSTSASNDDDKEISSESRTNDSSHDGTASSSSSSSSSTFSSLLSSDEESYSSSLAMHDIALWSTQAVSNYADAVDTLHGVDGGLLGAGPAIDAGGGNVVNISNVPASASTSALQPTPQQGDAADSSQLASKDGAWDNTVDTASGNRGPIIIKTVRYSAAELRAQRKMAQLQKEAIAAEERAALKKVEAVAAVAEDSASSPATEKGKGAPRTGRGGRAGGGTPTVDATEGTPTISGVTSPVAPTAAKGMPPVASSAPTVSANKSSVSKAMPTTATPPTSGAGSNTNTATKQTASYQSTAAIEGKKVIGLAEATLGHLMMANIGCGNGSSQREANLAVLRIGKGTVLLIFPVAMRAPHHAKPSPPSAAASAAVARTEGNGEEAEVAGTLKAPIAVTTSTIVGVSSAAAKLPKIRQSVRGSFGTSPFSCSSSELKFSGALESEERADLTVDACSWGDDADAVAAEEAVGEGSPTVGGGAATALSFASGSDSADECVLRGTTANTIATHSSQPPEMMPDADRGNASNLYVPQTASSSSQMRSISKQQLKTASAPPPPAVASVAQSETLSTFEASHTVPDTDHSIARLVVALEGFGSGGGGGGGSYDDASIGTTCRFIQVFIRALEREELRTGYLTREFEGMSEVMSAVAEGGSRCDDENYSQYPYLSLWWELQQLLRCIAGEDFGSALTLGATIGMGGRGSGSNTSSSIPRPLLGGYMIHPTDMIRRLQQHHFHHHLTINRSLHMPSLYLRHFDANDSRIAFLGSGKRQVLATARHLFPPEWAFVLNTSTSHFVRGGGFCHSCFIKEAMAPRYAQIMGHSGARALTIEAVRSILVSKLGNPPHTVRNLTRLLMLDIQTITQEHQNPRVGGGMVTPPPAFSKAGDDCETCPPGGGMGARAGTQTPLHDSAQAPTMLNPSFSSSSALSAYQQHAGKSSRHGGASARGSELNSSRANALAIERHQQQALSMIDNADALFFVAQVLELLSLSHVITLQRPGLALTMSDAVPIQHMSPAYVHSNLQRSSAFHFGDLFGALDGAGEEQESTTSPTTSTTQRQLPRYVPPPCLLGEDACTVCHFIRSWNIQRQRAAMTHRMRMLSLKKAKGMPCNCNWMPAANGLGEDGSAKPSNASLPPLSGVLPFFASANTPPLNPTTASIGKVLAGDVMDRFEMSEGSSTNVTTGGGTAFTTPQQEFAESPPCDQHIGSSGTVRFASQVPPTIKADHALFSLSPANASDDLLKANAMSCFEETLAKVMATPLLPPLMTNADNAPAKGDDVNGSRTAPFITGATDASSRSEGGSSSATPSNNLRSAARLASSNAPISFTALYQTFEKAQQRCEGFKRERESERAKAWANMASDDRARMDCLGMDDLPKPTLGLVPNCGADCKNRGSGKHGSGPGAKSAAPAASPLPSSFLGPLETLEHLMVSFSPLSGTEYGVGGEVSSRSPSFSSKPHAMSLRSQAVVASRTESALTKNRIIAVLNGLSTVEEALYETQFTVITNAPSGGQAEASSEGGGAFYYDAQTGERVLIASGGGAAKVITATTSRSLLSSSEFSAIASLAALHQYRRNNRDAFLSRAWVGCLPMAHYAAEAEQCMGLAAMEQRNAMAYEAQRRAGFLASSSSSLQQQRAASFGNYTSAQIITPSTFGTAGGGGWGGMHFVRSGSGQSGQSIGIEVPHSSSTVGMNSKQPDSLSKGVTFMMADRGWIANHPSLLEQATPPSPGRLVGVDFLNTPQMETPQTITTSATTVSNVNTNRVGAFPLSPSKRPLSAQSIYSPPHRSSLPPPVTPLAPLLSRSIHKAPKGYVPYPIMLTIVLQIVLLHGWCGHRLHTLKDMLQAIKEPMRAVGKALRKAKTVALTLDTSLKAMAAACDARQDASGPHIAFLWRYAALHAAERSDALRSDINAKREGGGGGAFRSSIDARQQNPFSSKSSSVPPSPGAPSNTGGTSFEPLATEASAAVYGAGASLPPPPFPLISHAFMLSVRQSVLVSLIERHSLTPLETLLHAMVSDSKRPTPSLSAEEEGVHPQETKLHDRTPPPEAVSNPFGDKGAFALPPTMSEFSLTHHILQHRAVFTFVCQNPPTTPLMQSLWISYVSWVRAMGDAPLEFDGFALPTPPLSNNVAKEGGGVASTQLNDGRTHGAVDCDAIAGAPSLSGSVIQVGGASTATTAVMASSLFHPSSTAPPCFSLRQESSNPSSPLGASSTMKGVSPFAVKEGAAAGPLPCVDAVDACAIPSLFIEADAMAIQQASLGDPVFVLESPSHAFKMAPPQQKQPSSPQQSPAHRHTIAETLASLQHACFVLGVDALVLAHCAGYRLYPPSSSEGLPTRHVSSNNAANKPHTNSASPSGEVPNTTQTHRAPIMAAASLDEKGQQGLHLLLLHHVMSMFSDLLLVQYATVTTGEGEARDVDGWDGDGESF